jgi:thiol:disulfide interchange protein
MKHLLRAVSPALFFLFFAPALRAQEKMPNPVTWKFTQEKLNDSEYVLNIEATIQKGWHIYSQHLDTTAIQNPTALTFTLTADFIKDGPTEEDGKLITVKDTAPKEIETYYLNTVTFKQKIIIRNHTAGFTVKGNVYYQTCNDGACLPPKQVDFSFQIPATPEESKSYLGIFLLGLAAGLGAIWTPCVFPMIPLTVSFFLKRNSNRKKGIKDAFAYSGSIIFIYVLLAIVITAVSGSDGLNAIASNGWLNLVYFLIFIIFGASFLGAFELVLPTAWANTIDRASEKGGLLGVFFMALTLCIISFSCTGPFLGSLLPAAALHGKYWSLVVGVFGFSISLSLPFALFAVFPSWLNSLPSSGGWLNSVKVVFGLLELAFALKFLSITDLGGLHIKFLHFHINGPMGIMRREVFLCLWIVIFTIMGFYLLGKIRFKHDSAVDHVNVFRLLLAIITFAFTVYLIPGLFGAPLKMISGFPPPSFYSEGWAVGGAEGAAPLNTNGNSTTTQAGGTKKNVKIGCPLNLNCFNDYQQAVEYAKQVNKPIMIDFTGISCGNCRKMEESVWPDPRVLALIKNDFVLTSLFVDDPTPLPDSLQYVSKTTGEKVETYGNKWSDMEASLYNYSTQPLYVLVDAKGNQLAAPTGYNPNIEEYLQFLTSGKSKFSSQCCSTP